MIMFLIGFIAGIFFWSAFLLLAVLLNPANFANDPEVSVEENKELDWRDENYKWAEDYD